MPFVDAVGLPTRTVFSTIANGSFETNRSAYIFIAGSFNGTTTCFPSFDNTSLWAEVTAGTTIARGQCSINLTRNGAYTEARLITGILAPTFSQDTACDIQYAFQTGVPTTFGGMGFSQLTTGKCTTGGALCADMNSGLLAFYNGDGSETRTSFSNSVALGKQLNVTIARNGTTNSYMCLNDTDSSCVASTTGMTAISNFTLAMNSEQNVGFTVTGIACYNYTLGAPMLPTVAPPAPDTTPPSILELNMTSEGSPYKVNLTNPFCSGDVGSNCKVPRTNDTTPTFRMRLSESGNCTVIDLNRNLNYSDIVRGGSNIGEDGSTDFNCVVTLNSENASRIGLWNFSMSATDDAGNQNSTATLFFTMNITNPDGANITLFTPQNTSSFRRNINNTGIFNFNWTANDNYDTSISNCSLWIDNSFYYNTTNFANGSKSITNLTISDLGLGLHYWNVTCINSFNNLGASRQFQFEITDFQINFSLNEPPNRTVIKAGIIQFNYTVNYTETIDKCFLILANKLNVSNRTLITSNTRYNMNASLTNGDYNWSVGCNLSSGTQINSSDKFTLYVADYPTIAFVNPTPANNTIILADFTLINVSATGSIFNYIVEFNGTNLSLTAFNSTSNILLNKTGLEDLKSYRYKVYANDSAGRINSTEERTVRTNFLGLVVSVTTGITFSFAPDIYYPHRFFTNETLVWGGNNTAITLKNRNIINGTESVYNNNTKLAYGNYTLTLASGKITFLNSTSLFNGSTGLLLTNQLNISYIFTSPNATVRQVNISCTGQNETIGCLNFSALSSSQFNMSLLFNITNDPVSQKIIEDFSTSALNWTVGQQRSNNTMNRSLFNFSAVCGEIQSLDSIGLVEYRFNNTFTLIYLNSTNQSALINTTTNCTSPNYYTKLLNNTQINISGFDFFNFSWKGDNTTNTFIISIVSSAGTKVSSSSLRLDNPNFNFSGFSLGTLANITAINISVTNVSGTKKLSGFFLDNLKLTNSTSNQSVNVKMKASCTGNYANSTILLPNILTNMCAIPANQSYKAVWLYQDINLSIRKGLRWKLQYNASKI